MSPIDRSRVKRKSETDSFVRTTPLGNPLREPKSCVGEETSKGDVEYVHREIVGGGLFSQYFRVVGVFPIGTLLYINEHFY